MSITDELRERTDRFHNFNEVAMLLAIADRIDAEHQKALDERDSERFNALMDAREKGVSAVLKEPEGFGLVELPKDADGKHIQPSDIPHLTKTNDGKRLAFCSPLELRQDGTWMLAGWTLDRYRILKPTVEDVLREFVSEFNRDDAELCDEEIIERFAAKLRLAEGED